MDVELHGLVGGTLVARADPGPESEGWLHALSAGRLMTLKGYGEGADGQWEIVRVQKETEGGLPVVTVTCERPKPGPPDRYEPQVEAVRRLAIRDAVTIVRQGLRAAGAWTDIADEQRADARRAWPRPEHEPATPDGDFMPLRTRGRDALGRTHHPLLG